MLVKTLLLLKYGGIAENFGPADVIFHEGESPLFYYQIITGKVKLNHIDEEDKELIQSILTDGQSICELLSFGKEKFPVNAIAMAPTAIIKIPNKDFSRLLAEHPQANEAVQRFAAERLYHKFILMQNNASKHSKVRINGILTYFKGLNGHQGPYAYEVPLTRKQLAAVTGLRIETVIRTVKKMEDEALLKIKNRKIFF